MAEVDVTYDQGEFHEEKEVVDWGVLVTIYQGGVRVCVVALDAAGAAQTLRDAADAVEAKGDG